MHESDELIGEGVTTQSSDGCNIRYKYLAYICKNMETKRLSKFYCLSISKRVYLKVIENFCPKLLKLEEDDDEYHHQYSIPAGISDAWTVNDNYKLLIRTLDIDKQSNIDSIEAIKRQLDQDDKSAIENSIFLQQVEMDVDVEADPRWRDVELDKGIIFLWRSTKLKTSDIALKVGTTTAIVEKCIKNYKTKVKIQAKISKMSSYERMRVIDEEIGTLIKDFWKRNLGNRILIRNIKAHIRDNFPQRKVPSDTTITKFLKKKLSMSYRMLHARHPKSLSEDHIRLFWESVIIQQLLREDSYELIYIDEFSISDLA